MLLWQKNYGRKLCCDQNSKINLIKKEIISVGATRTQPVARRCSDVVTTFLCMSQRHRMYISNKIPNNVSVERRQDISVVRLHDVLLEFRDDVSRGSNDHASSVHLHDVSNKPQMKHLTTSQWNVKKTSQWHVSTTCH